MSSSIRQATDKMYRTIGIISLVLIAAFLIIKFINIKLIEQKTSAENIIILEKLKATTKLVIWEQDFTVNNITQKEKKYFNSDFLKFTEKVITTARGRIGFHIDLGDTISTSYVLTADAIEIHAPLQITYVNVDNSTIQQIKESSIHPSLNVDKTEIIRRLNEIALRENLKPALAQVKKNSLSQQEQALEALTGRKVKIIFTSLPDINNGLKLIKKG